jgi:hypothetical protein
MMSTHQKTENKLSASQWETPSFFQPIFGASRQVDTCRRVPVIRSRKSLLAAQLQLAIGSKAVGRDAVISPIEHVVCEEAVEGVQHRIEPTKGTLPSRKPGRIGQRYYTRDDGGRAGGAGACLNLKVFH